MKRHCSIILATLVFGFPSTVEAAQRVFADVFVNQVPVGETLIYLVHDDIEVPQTTIQKSGLIHLNFATVSEAGLPYVSLHALAPTLTFHYDEDATRLDISSGIEHLGETTFDLAAQTDSAIDVEPTRAAYFNYAVTRSYAAPVSISGQLGAGIADGLLSAQFSYAGNRPQFTQTQYSIDDVPRSQRFIVGDSQLITPVYDPLAGTGEIVGLVARRESEINPNALRATDLGFSGFAASPSTVDVFVNGSLVSQQQVAPGRFSIKNIPVGIGLNAATIVVHDAFGRTQTSNRSLFSGQQFIRRGTTDFVYAAGRLLNAPNGGSVSNPPAISANINFGLNDAFNTGTRIELEPAMYSVGAHMNIAAPVGQLTTSFAASRKRGVPGSAGAANYFYSHNRFAVAAGIIAYSSGYAHIGLDPQNDRTTRLTNFNITKLIGGHALSLTRQLSVDRDVGASRQTQLTDGFTVRGVALSFGKSWRSTPTASGSGLTINVNYQISGSRYASYTNNQSYAGGAQSLLYTRALPTDEGLGYQIATRDAYTGGLPIIGNATYAFRNGTLFGAFDGSELSTLSYSGSLVYIDHTFAISRAVNGSYGIVKTNIPNIDVRVNNLAVGKTDKHGRALVSNLIAYVPNSVSIAADEAPLSEEILNADVRVRPVHPGGIIIPFQSHHIHAYTGRVMLRTGTAPSVPAGGTFHLHSGSGDVETEIGNDGKFYFENLDAGKYDAVINDGTSTCTFTFIAPASTEALTRMDDQTCGRKP